MKKAIILSVLSLAVFGLTNSVKAQSQNTCYAYGHHKVACPGSTADQKTVSPKEEVKQTKDQGEQTDKKESASDKRKYNATEFKTKHYFFGLRTR